MQNQKLTLPPAMSRQLLMLVATADRTAPMKMTEVQAINPRFTPHQSSATPPIIGHTLCVGAREGRVGEQGSEK